MATCQHRLPRPIATEILRQYADILRLGSLHVNGHLVTWDASAQRLPEERLDAFSEALGKALQAVPEVGMLVDKSLCEGACYWICKALSINYALVEVLQLVKRRANAVCSIESWTGKSSLGMAANYHVELQPGPALRVGISWNGKSNIVSYNPSTSEKQVMGTLSSVETEFALPPACGFAPEYQIQMELCKAHNPFQLPIFACTPREEQADLTFDRIVLAAPLRRTLPRADFLPQYQLFREKPSRRVPEVSNRSRLSSENSMSEFPVMVHQMFRHKPSSHVPEVSCRSRVSSENSMSEFPVMVQVSI